MYLRHKDLKEVMKVAQAAFTSVLEPGQFLKIGFDVASGGVKSYWVFVPDFVSDKKGGVEDEVMVIKEGPFKK